MNRHEALGRYVEAAEAARLAAERRDDALAALSRQIAMTTALKSNTVVARDFDFAQAQSLLAQAGDAHADLTDATAQANAVATLAGKAPLTIR